MATPIVTPKTLQVNRPLSIVQRTNLYLQKQVGPLIQRITPTKSHRIVPENPYQFPTSDHVPAHTTTTHTATVHRTPSSQPLRSHVDLVVLRSYREWEAECVK